MTSGEIVRRLLEDPDFVNSKRAGYSLKAVLERYPNGVPERIIANCLNVDEERVKVLYEEAVVLLRDIMKVDLE